LRYAVGAPKMPDHGLVAAAVAVVPCEEVIDSAGLHRPALAGQTRVLGGLEDRPDRVLVAVRGRRLKRAAVGPWPFRALLQAVAERALAHAHLPGDLPDRGAFVHHVRCDHDLLLSQFGHLCPPCVKSSRRVPNSPNSARGGCVQLGVSRGARWRDSLQLSGRLSARLREWRERPLAGAYPYLYLDGISVSVRWGGASERVSVLVAIGVSEEGFREVLACVAGFRESEESWRGLLRELMARGLKGVRLVISDACQGLKAAVQDFLPQAAWQRCTVHVMRNVLEKVPQTRRAEVAAALKTIWHQESAQEAHHK